jgi:RNA-binding protein
MTILSSRERKALRGRGHHLEPVVRVGQAGIHPGVIHKIEIELRIHELIKIKVGQGAPLGAKEAAPLLVEQTGAALVQVIGGVILLYKERPPEDEDQE